MDSTLPHLPWLAWAAQRIGWGSPVCSERPPACRSRLQHRSAGGCLSVGFRFLCSCFNLSHRQSHKTRVGAVCLSVYLSALCSAPAIPQLPRS